jgi:hypothetical protein
MDVILNVLSFLAGIALVYLTAYVKVKGKNKALIEDVAKLESDKQNIIAKYRAETEELKKQHTLEIEKKKFQYEDKRTQFSKYFGLLDEFHGKCNSVFGEKFQPIITEFMNSYLVDDPDVQHQATVKYSENVQKLFFELNAEHLKLQTETNSIRLISSPKIDVFLNSLESGVKLATDQTTEMLQFMAKPEFWADQSLVVPYQDKLAVSAKEVIDCRNQLREQMKVELNEI